MKPVSPVIPGAQEIEVVYARNQPQYQPLPVIRTKHVLMSRWQLTDEERQHLASGGDLFLLHLGTGIQPTLPVAASPQMALDAMMELDAIQNPEAK